MLLAHRFALESPLITADMISAVDFQEMAYHAEVSSVPHTVIQPGDEVMIGAYPESVLLSRIRQSLTAKE